MADVSKESRSSLITVPVEVRLNILENLFSTITVRHGLKSTSTTNTSILRACKLLHEEALPLLPLHVLFHFRSPSVMLDTLTALPQIVLEKIRHIQLKSFPFPLYSNQERFYYTTYNMSEALCMLPGLQLDTLTVEDCYHEPDEDDDWGDLGTYHDIQSLIMVHGWKELRYVTPSTKFMTGLFDQYKTRKKQPEHWDQTIRTKDQGSSNAFVKMYLAVTPKLKGLTSNPVTRTNWGFEPRRCSSGQADNEEDCDDNDREVLVFARRGAGVNYIQDGNGLNKDIKLLLEQMSWKELRASSRYINGELDSSAHL